MSKTKFTPGPWVTSTTVCSVYGPEQIPIAHTSKFRKHEEARKANANLIAAAPDLYNVLVRLCVATETDFAIGQIRNEAYDILARARGEQTEPDHPSDGDQLLDDLHDHAPTPYDL